jgi:hypothetical protein
VLLPLRVFHERFVDLAVHEERLELERRIVALQQSRVRKGPAAELLVRRLRGDLPRSR